MINFFRKIRRNLLSERKTHKYLKYAIGEIVLVVLGILIALQINNWNENRKLRNLEHKLLIDIRSNLIASDLNLKFNLAYNKNTITNYENILKHIEEDLPYHFSLDSAFSYISYWSDPTFTFTAYETLKSKGLDIIKNDSLKKAITDIYEVSFPFVMNEMKAEWELHQRLVLPFVVKNIKYFNSETARPINFSDLKVNPEFHNLMGIKMITRNHSIQFAEGVKESVNSLITMIDEELNKN
jgi:hypothetical protein